MPVTQEESEAKGFVGSKVSTPDGAGKITAVNERYISVKLENGTEAQFTHREVSVESKKKG